MAVTEQSAREEPRSKIPDVFLPAIWFAYAGVFVVATLCIGLDSKTFLEMWHWPDAASGDPVHMAFFFARIILFFELLLYTYRWIEATYVQAEIWVTWLGYRQTPREAMRAMFALALALGMMLAFADHVVFITGFFTTYLLLNYYTQWFCNKWVEKSLASARKQDFEDTHRRETLDRIEGFWIDSPQLARITTMMFISSVAFALALAGHVQPESRRIAFQLAAYIILIANILIGESVIFIWRRALYRAIDGPLTSCTVPGTNEPNQGGS